MRHIFYLSILVLIIVNLQYRLEKIRKVSEKAEEILYLPRGRVLEYVALDHKNFFADLLWLQFIQYYGYHLQTDRKYPYLFPILDVLTDIDKKFLHAYTFGSILLAHDCRDRKRSTELIKKGMYNNPERWEYPWWLGFLNYTFWKDYQKAGRYFRLASLKPGAPEMTYRWAAFVYYKKLKNLETALLLWQEMYRKAKNKYEKAIAEYYIKRTIMKIHLRDLQKAVEKFYNNKGFYPASLYELLKEGYISGIPKEPFGGRYILQDGKVYSTSQKND